MLKIQSASGEQDRSLRWMMLKIQQGFTMMDGVKNMMNSYLFLPLKSHHSDFTLNDILDRVFQPIVIFTSTTC